MESGKKDCNTGETALGVRKYKGDGCRMGCVVVKSTAESKIDSLS